MFRAFLLSALFALPAAADCLNKDNLATGIAFIRQDGSTGNVIAKGKDVLVEYVTNRNGWYDSRTTKAGIFETHFTFWLSDALLVGSVPPVYDWRFKSALPELAPGMQWETRIRQIETNVGYGTEMVEMVSKRGSDIDAQFVVKPEAEAKLSGCSYRIWPVEASFLGKAGKATRRWIYFPDLGFGLETVRDTVKNGLTALTPM